MSTCCGPVAARSFNATRPSTLQALAATTPGLLTASRLVAAPCLLAAASPLLVRDGPPILIHLIRVARRLKSATAVDAVRWTLTAGCVGSGLLSGLYFIFSFCVMQSLNEQPPSRVVARLAQL